MEIVDRSRLVFHCAGNSMSAEKETYFNVYLTLGRDEEVKEGVKE